MHFEQQWIKQINFIKHKNTCKHKTKLGCESQCEQKGIMKPRQTEPPAPHPTCASLCWLSASPVEISACLASSMRSAEPSITSRAESSMAAAALGSVVEAATPRAAWASVLRAWAVSLAAIPTHSIRERAKMWQSTVTKAYLTNMYPFSDHKDWHPTAMWTNNSSGF